jgi:hypothetical protein
MATCTCAETSHNHKNPCGKEVTEGNLCLHCRKEKDKTAAIFHRTAQAGHQGETRKP